MSSHTLPGGDVRAKYGFNGTGAQANYLQLALDAMGDAVICTDTHGRLSFMNKKAMKLLSCHSGRVLGQRWNDVFSLIDENLGRPIDDPFQSCVISGRCFTNGTGCILRIASGREVFVEANATPVYEESEAKRIIGAIMTLRDLTDISELLATVFRQGPHDVLASLLDHEAFLKRLTSALLGLHGQKEHILLEIEISPRHTYKKESWLGIEESVFRQVTALLTSRIRDRDALGSANFSKYHLLLEHCDCEEGMHLAKELRRILQEHEFFIQGQTYNVDSHIGVVSLNQPYVRIKDIFYTADRACQMAKASMEGAILVVPNQSLIDSVD